MRIFVHSKNFMIITIEKKNGINNEMGELMKPNQFSGEDALLVEFEEMGFDHLQLLLPWSPKKRFKFSPFFFFFFFFLKNPSGRNSTYS